MSDRRRRAYPDYPTYPGYPGYPSMTSPVALRFALRPGRHADLRFRVPDAVLGRAEALRVRRLRLAVTAPAAPYALQARYVAAARPVRSGRGDGRDRGRR